MGENHYSKKVSYKTHTQDYREVSEAFGKYMNFGQAVKHYGGWKWNSSIGAAKRTFAKAIRLGGKWIDYDESSELLTVLILEKQHRTIFDEKWSLAKKEWERNDTEVSTRAIKEEEAPSGADRTSTKSKGKSGQEAESNQEGGGCR